MHGQKNIKFSLFQRPKSCLPQDAQGLLNNDVMAIANNRVKSSRYLNLIQISSPLMGNRGT